MGTRSTIAIKHGDRIKAVYCHWDGYLEHNGRILLEHYDSTKTNFLVALGDISSLRANIGEAHPFSKFEIETDDPERDAKLALLNRAESEEWTTFYGRDRNEIGTLWKSFGSEAEWMDHYDGSGVEYYYIMDNGVWYVSAYRNSFKPLHEEIANLDKEPA